MFIKMLPLNVKSCSPIWGWKTLTRRWSGLLCYRLKLGNICYRPKCNLQVGPNVRFERSYLEWNKVDNVRFSWERSSLLCERRMHAFKIDSDAEEHVVSITHDNSCFSLSFFSALSFLIQTSCKSPIPISNIQCFSLCNVLQWVQ